MDRMVVDDVDDENNNDNSRSATSVAGDDNDTLDENEYEVKQVLAEQLIGGQQMYLIEWLDYDLTEATWEPFEHLHDDVYQVWIRIKSDETEASKAKSRRDQWIIEKTAQVQETKAHLEEENNERARKGLSPIPLDDITKKAILELRHLPHTDELSGTSGTGQGAASRPIRDASTAASSSSRAGAGATTDPESDARLPGRRRSSLGGSLSSSATSGPSKQPMPRRNTSDAVPSAALKPKEPGWKGTARPGQSSRERPAPTRNVAFRPGPPIFRASAGISKRTPKAQTQASGVDSNVFAGGKQPRSRGTLRDAASDPSKGQKFLRLGLARELEKQCRDHEGAIAPAKLPRHLISLDRNNPHSIMRESPGPSAPAAPGEPSADLMDMDGGQAIESSGNETRLDQGTSAASERPAAAPKAIMKDASRSIKRKKSVTWSSEVGGPADSDGESSLFVRGDSSISSDGTDTNHRGNNSMKDTTPMEGISAPLAPMSLSQGSDVPSDRQTLQKLSQLGKGSLQYINLSFHGVPATNDLAWVSRIQNEDPLIFTHICSAKDFQSQFRMTVNKLLVGGTVSSFTNSASLTALADRSRLGPRGLLCRVEGFSMLLFPSGCFDWNFLQESSASVSGTTWADHPLRYIIFEPQPSFEDQLAPIPFSDLLDQPDTLATLYTRKFETIFGFEYEDLLPQATKMDPNARHSFFLLFPPRAWKEVMTLSRWLKAAHPECEIRSSLSPGHWASFQSLEQGSVIIHEDCLSLLRKIPNLSTLLYKRRKDFTFLTFQKSLLPTSILESGEVTENRIGDIHLREVFNGGIAVLLTPSFFLAHPKKAFSILSWLHDGFLNNEEVTRHATVAVCHDMGGWLHDLALEKAEKQMHLSKGVSDSDLRSMGLDDESLVVRWNTYDLFRRITTASASETSSLFVCAPRSIDGNDEQSLVNWFGWWSVMNIEAVGRFAVLGSGPTSRERLTRRISVVYEPGTQNDPDPSDVAVAEAPPLGAPTAPRPSANEVISLTRDLQAMVDTIKGQSFCPVILYYFPVAHWHFNMPWDHGDIRSDFRSYREWINYFQDGPIGTRPVLFKKVNTFAGFFHTAEESPGALGPQRLPRRHPWLAFLRPKNLHLHPWRSRELLIWDMAYEKKLLTAQAFTVDDLPEAHRELVLQVEDALKDDLPLTSVWVGGFPLSRREPGGHPIEITLDALHGTLEDLRNWIPLAPQHLLARGWSRVGLAGAGRRGRGNGNGNPSSTSASGPNGEGGPDPDNGEKTRAQIFHPPPGDRGREPSKCRNRLFDAAVSARETAGDNSFEYTYQLTADWYRAQCEEGRGYQHIWMTTWEEFYKDHNIPQSEQT